MVTKERLQIILDLSPIPAQALVDTIKIDGNNVTITTIEVDEHNGSQRLGSWSTPVKGNLFDEHTLD